jgi:hypothetical protein
MSYETRDASLRVVAISTGILVFWIATSLGAAAWVYCARYSPVEAGVSARAGSFTEGYRMKSSIQADWTRLRDETGDSLHRYRWVDRNAGVAEIPLERAMELVLQHGLPEGRNVTPASVSVGQEVRR